jgi:hypothetical protein
MSITNNSLPNLFLIGEPMMIPQSPDEIGGKSQIGGNALVVFAMVFIAVCFLLIVTMLSAASATGVCLTKKDARQLWPRQHLYWYSKDHCWSNRRGPPRGLKLDPVDPVFPKRVMAQASESQTEIGMDANGTPPSNIPVIVDPFVQPKEPIRMIMVPEYAKKEDRLSEQKIDPPPVPVQTETIKAPAVKPKLSSWFFLLLVLGFLSTLSAFAIINLQPRSKSNVRTRNHAARPNHRPQASGELPVAGSDGAGNQQSYFHSWQFPRWRWRTDIGGHAVHPDPVADRGDDFSAIGSWARSRGFRPEESNADQPVSDRPSRKRFAIFASR